MLFLLQASLFHQSKPVEHSLTPYHLDKFYRKNLLQHQFRNVDPSLQFPLHHWQMPSGAKLLLWTTSHFVYLNSVVNFQINPKRRSWSSEQSIYFLLLYISKALTEFLSNKQKYNEVGPCTMHVSFVLGSSCGQGLICNFIDTTNTTHCGCVPRNNLDVLSPFSGQTMVLKSNSLVKAAAVWHKWTK